MAAAKRPPRPHKKAARAEPSAADQSAADQSIRERLAQSRTPGNRPGSAGQLERWLASHPAAVTFLDNWLRMRAAGETGWSLRDVVSELRTAEYGMPAFSSDALRAWLERNRHGLFKGEAN